MIGEKEVPFSIIHEHDFFKQNQSFSGKTVRFLKKFQKVWKKFEIFRTDLENLGIFLKK